MSSLSISAAWEQAKAVLARDGRLFAAVALALVALPNLLLAVIGAPVSTGAPRSSTVAYFIVLLCAIIAHITLNRLAIGPAVTVGEALRRGVTRAPSIVLLVIIATFAAAMLAVAVAFLLAAVGAPIITSPDKPTLGLILVLLAIILLIAAIFLLVFPIAAAETGNPLRLISRALQLARGHYLRLLGFAMAALFGGAIIGGTVQAGFGSAIVLLAGPAKPGSISAVLVGLVAGVLQAALTVVVATMLARIYVQLAGRGDAQASVPSSGT